MAFLGGALRDASVLADGKLVVWSLRRQDLDDTAREDPEMVARLYEGLSLELAERLRQANRMIDALGR
jgi:CRP-like cAMP-binding protein